MDIINLIRHNKLMYLTEEKLVDEIKKLTNLSCPAIKKEINKLILDGSLFLDDANKISISDKSSWFAVIIFFLISIDISFITSL